MKKVVVFVIVTVMLLGFGFIESDTAFSAGCTGNYPVISASPLCSVTTCTCVPRPSCVFNDCLNNYNITSRCSSGFEQCVTVTSPCEAL